MVARCVWMALFCLGLIGPAPADADSDAVSTGSGFFFADGGLVATNYHVAGDCKTLTVAGYGRARLIKGDKGLDLAALQLDSHRGAAPALVSSTAPALAQSVILLGYPLSDLLNSSLNVSTGIVSSESGFNGDPDRFTTNAGIEPGNSGGPVLDAYGNVLGVATSKLDEQQLLDESDTVAPNIGFAIKSTTLLKFLHDLKHREAPAADGPAPSLQQAVRAASKFTVEVICDDSGGDPDMPSGGHLESGHGRGE